MLTVYSKSGCSYCTKAKELLTVLNIKYEERSLDDSIALSSFKETYPFVKTLPYIIEVGNEIGGYDKLEAVVKIRNNLIALLKKSNVKINFSKVNGEDRTIVATLKDDVIPKPAKHTFLALTLWDIQTSSWKKLYIQNIYDWEEVQ
jgi:glutaredoxin